MRSDKAEINQNSAANPIKISQNNTSNSDNSVPQENQDGGFSEEEIMFIRNKMRPMRIMEIAFLFILFGVLAYIWLYVLKNPVPKGLIRIFGMDDTLYPEQYEKMKERLGKK